MSDMFQGIQGMRPQDAGVFHNYCMQQKLWMLVRYTNPDSLKYVGLQDYYPKPIDCKPKTAELDVARKDGKGKYELRGLLVDPTLHPGAFGQKKLDKTKALWASFAEHFDLKSGTDRYKVDLNPQSKHYGCLMVRAPVEYNYIHGDYDLKDIIEVGYEDWNLAFPMFELSTPHNEIFLQKHELRDVIRAINDQIGAPMLQHGSEMQFADHSQDRINVFGPKGEFLVLLDLAGIQLFYDMYFPYRRGLTGERAPRVGNLVRIPAFK
jgi:hypothetical protein